MRGGGEELAYIIDPLSFEEEKTAAKKGEGCYC